jgi:hypothetical protein
VSESSYSFPAAPVDRARRLATSIPTWAWLTAMVAASIVVRAVISRGSPAPWIFDDELIYSELARSFAWSGTFALRDVEGLLGYGPVYPALISPAYAVFHGVGDAYEAAKALNALYMSLAAVPAYLIARTVLGRWQSLGAAALALLVPSLAYTSVIMTENAFYPAFLVCALAFVRVLARPTLRRQAVALAAVGLTYTIRAQAVALVPALMTALVLFAALEARASSDGLHVRTLLRRLDAFRATWLAIGVGSLLVVAVQAARGKPLRTLLGAYQDVAGWGYSVGDVARWLLYHLAELDLYLGVLPFAALLVVFALACRRAGATRELRAFAAVTAPLVLWLALSASLLSSHIEDLDGIGRIEERNVFHVAPLFLVALLVWADRGFVRHRLTTLAAAAVAGGLPAVIPYAKFMNLGVLSDTLAFVPLVRAVLGGDIDPGDVRRLVVIGSVEAAVIFAFLPRRVALVGPLLVGMYLVLWQAPLIRQIHDTSSGVLAGAITEPREWVDDAVGRDAEVAALWTGAVSELSIQETDFFNGSMGKVYAFASAPPLGQQLPEVASTLNARNGAVLGADGLPVTSPYVLADFTTSLHGTPVARDSTVGLTLYRTGGPVRIGEIVSGRYGDGWSGPALSYTRYDCDPGRLLATVSGYRGLIRGPQTIVALVEGRAVARAVLPVYDRTQRLAVRLRPRSGSCTVTFTISPTAVPSDVFGSTDARVLGVHFDDLRYLPARP